MVDLWRSRSGQPGLYERVTPDVLEQLVFAKLYFDYPGLIIACDDDRPLGFAHAGFGPNDACDGIATEMGVTSLVLVRPDCDTSTVAAGLLERSEAYLRQRGAQVLYGGGINPLNPFYLGLYGGSELPGVLASDRVSHDLYTSHGYREIDRTMVLHRNLSNFQSPIDRYQMQIRRRMVVEVTTDAPTCNWWEASTLGDFDLTRFEIIPRGGGTPVARAVFRGLEPMGTVGAGRTAGLVDMWVDESLRHRGLAVFVLSEAFRQFIRQGITLVEAQVMQHNAAGIALYEKLGFQLADQGSVFRKDIANAE